MASLSLRGVARRFTGASEAALKPLDLEVSDGELVVLVGPSGCGKSTALRLIAGLDDPDAGSVVLDGRDVTRTAPQDRDVAMVFQGYALYPHMTVGENIAFPLKMRGIARAERERKVRDAALLLGIEKLLERSPGELSGGERQRVAMGRAIVRAPKLFLFDEPLANLDAALRAELRVEIAALVRRLGVTALYVTHDQVEAMTMADRIAVLRKGELLQIDTPRRVYESPATTFVAGFLGAPPINLVTVDAEGNGAGGAWPRKSVIAGVRAEHVRVNGDGVFSATTGSASGPLIEAEIKAIEPLGAETHLALDAAGTPLRARAPGFAELRVGERVRLAIDLAHVLWFDAATGKRAP